MRNVPINKGVTEKHRLLFDSHDEIAIDTPRVKKKKISKEALPCQDNSSCHSGEKAYKKMALQSQRNASTSSIRSPSKDVDVSHLANVPSERKGLLEDLKSLDGTNWLTDGVIDRIFAIFSKTFSNNKIKLLSQGLSTMLLFNYDTVRVLDLPSYSLVFIPVNNEQTNPNYRADAGNHFSLLDLDMTKAGKPVFRHHDSAGVSNWKVAERLAKRIKEVLPAFAKAQVCNAPVPQQVDSYNCGVYVLAITQAICEWFMQNQESAHNLEYDSFMEDRVKVPRKVHNMRRKYYNMILKDEGVVDPAVFGCDENFICVMWELHKNVKQHIILIPRCTRMDHVNWLQNEPPPFGYGSTTMRLNDLASSSYAGQSCTQQMGAPGMLHALFAGYPHVVCSSSIYAPHDSQNLPAQKQNNPIIPPMDGAGVGSCYAANLSNP